MIKYLIQTNDNEFLVEETTSNVFFAYNSEDNILITPKNDFFKKISDSKFTLAVYYNNYLIFSFLVKNDYEEDLDNFY